MKKLSSACIITAIAGLLAGCPSQEGRINLAPGEKFRISQEAYDTFQNEYLRLVGPGNRGAFAVTEMGYGTAYSWCPGSQCMPGTNYSRDAIKLCEDAGVKCVIFARNSEIVVPYEIIP